MTKKLTALIVDDEAQTRASLIGMLQEFCPEVIIAGQAKNVDEALDFMNTKKIDVAFLDINLGDETTSFDILDKLKKYNCAIVFVTAHANYALKAFEYGALNYLLKPVRSGDLIETVERVIKTQNPTNLNYDALNRFITGNYTGQKIIALPNKNQTDFIALEDIEYIEADGSYSIYHLIDGSLYTMSRNLKYFEENTTGVEQFVRVHKSYLVNKHHVKSIAKTNGGFITMKSGAKVDITISYHGMLENLIEEKK
jgi:two-component system LytT family response regulator